MPSYENNLQREDVITQERNLESFFQPILALLGSQDLRLKIKRDPRIPSAAFSHELKEIIINPDFYKEFREKLPPQDREATLMYVIAHELCHNIQALEDPQEYLRSFELAEEWSREYREEYFELIKKIWNDLFNVFLDLNVAKKIEGYFIPFQKGGSKGYLPIKIYQEILFPNKDFSTYPLTSQFINTILREGVVEEEVVVSSEIREILKRKVNFFGNELTLQDLIYKYLMSKGTTVGSINFVIKKYIKPIFKELLEKDIQADRLPQALNLIIKVNFPHQSKEINKELAKYILKKRRTQEERERDLANKLFDEWAAKAGFSEEEKTRLKEIIEKSEKYIENLKQIWYQIIRVTQEQDTEKKVGFKIGAGIEPTRIASQYPTILQTPEDAQIFYRYLPEIKEKILPRNIKIILILDMSGSMDDEKRKRVQETIYPLLHSLIAFEDELALNSPEGVSPIKVESKIIGFGDNTIFLPQVQKEDPQIRIAQTIIDFQRIDLGGTKDSEALQLANNQFSTEDLEQIKRGELLGFVLEITDGETFTEQNSKRLVREMNEKGILTKAIQIPTFGNTILEKISQKPLNQEEEKQLRNQLSGTFKRVWEKHGECINSLEQLKSIILILLEEVLKKK